MKQYAVQVCFFLSTLVARAAVDGPLTPAQALATFRLDPGLKIECVASEPMVVSPVAVAWDEEGRMYVVEDRGYPIGPGKGKKPVGQVVLLESTHHDGRYDKRTVFADGLTFPNGVMCWKGGVFVTCAPYLYYFKDTNGDGIADVKQIVFKGFQDLSTAQLRVSHPVLNIDNWIYLTSGLTTAKVTSPLYPDHPAVVCRYSDFRFRPDTDQFEPNVGTAQFGETFDSFGRKFICSNRNHNQVTMLQLKYTRRNPNLAVSGVVEDIPDHGAAARVYPLSANITTFADQAGYFTSACGIFYYRGDALPAEYRDNSFTCEPAGNLVHRDVISPSNSCFTARRAQDGVEFLASPDNWCRPVNIASGPDGALYVCDMYRKTIEHPDYLPEATRKITDFDSGKDMGRIYRITAINPEPQPARPDLAQAGVKQLCQVLNDPDAWWRSTAQRLLLERKDKAAAPHLAALCKNAVTPETRVLALQLLDALGALSDRQLDAALKDKSPGVRENALQLAESRLAHSKKLAAHLPALADDPNPRVRFQCALSLGEMDGPAVIPALAKITMRNVNDHWTRDAVLTSVDHHVGELLHLLLVGQARTDEGMAAMLVELCRMLGITEPVEKLPPFVNEIAAPTAESDVSWQQAAFTGMAEGLHGRAALMSLVSGDSPAARQTRVRLDYLAQRCLQTVTNKAQTLNERLIALRFLAITGAGNTAAILFSMVDPQQPPEIQVAAIRAIGTMPDSSTLTNLLGKERWSTYSPPVREAVLACVMPRPSLVNALLAAIETGQIPAWAINPDRRNELARYKDEAIKTRAAALFKSMQSGDRMKVYEQYKSILTLAPNPANGHAIFTRTCTGCHVYAGEGHLVGPDLTGIRNLPKEVLLLHIIIPEYEIMPIYTCYNVETRDGNTLVGLLAAETPASITLRQPLGHEETIQRSNIASMTASRLSLMPDELEKGMSRQDMADLISFLKGM